MRTLTQRSEALVAGKTVGMTKHVRFLRHVSGIAGVYSMVLRKPSFKLLLRSYREDSRAACRPPQPHQRTISSEAMVWGLFPLESLPGFLIVLHRHIFFLVFTCGCRCDFFSSLLPHLFLPGRSSFPLIVGVVDAGAQEYYIFSTGAYKVGRKGTYD